MDVIHFSPFFDVCRPSTSPVVNRYADIAFPFDVNLYESLAIRWSLQLASHVKVGVTAFTQKSGEKTTLLNEEDVHGSRKNFRHVCLASFYRAPICILRMDNSPPFVSDCIQTDALSVIVCSSVEFFVSFLFFRTSPFRIRKLVFVTQSFSFIVLYW